MPIKKLSCKLNKSFHPVNHISGSCLFPLVLNKTNTSLHSIYHKKDITSSVTVVYACNPRSSGDRDQEDCSVKSPQANSL
jgi:hypothetical protein